jgi:hypothetical protein
MFNSFSLSAGQLIEFNEPGDFFRILAADAPVTVRYYYAGREIAEAEGVGAGYAEKFKAGTFDRLTIYSASAQALQVVTRLGSEVAYDEPPVGNVSVVNTSGAFTQAQATVTNASGQLLAAKATRRYLLVQNNDAAGVIYLALDGAAATVGRGIKIDPGGSYECAGYVPSGAVHAIGSVASNTAVVVVEG